MAESFFHWNSLRERRLSRHRRRYVSCTRSSTVENGRSLYRWAVFTITPETKGCRRPINSVHASSVFARRQSSSNCCAVNSLSFIEYRLKRGNCIPNTLTSIQKLGPQVWPFVRGWL